MSEKVKIGFIGVGHMGQLAHLQNYAQLKDLASLHEAREKGLVRQEGKEYVLQDGDVVLFKFNN